ncbi:MAG: hypothetical protein ACK52I_02770 [Pseudomonadota bacterium]|jgi:hypothetical protein
MKKSKKYFRQIDKLETQVLKEPILLWELEKNGDYNAFSILAYQTLANDNSRHIVLVQCFYDGSCLSVYLPDGEITYQGSAAKVAKLPLKGALVE